MLKTMSVVSALGILVVLVAAACGGGDGEAETSTLPTSTPTRAVPTEAPTRSSEQQATESPTIAAPPDSESGRLVEVTNRDPGGGSDTYKFDPKDFTFKLGETITFQVTAQTEFHTFDVNELGISVELEPGETKEVTVTMKVAGTFKLFCIPHQSKGMEGTITVE